MRRSYTFNIISRAILAIMMMASVNVWAQEPEPTNVAKIGDTPYTTLQTAINAATEGQTVELIAESEITESVTNTNTNSFTIDLNDKTWNGSGETAALIQNATSGTITITGSSGSIGAITCNAGGSLSITGGTVSGNTTNAGTLTISDGTISGNITNTGTLNISGGTIVGTITNNGGTISITGGTFTNKPEAGWIASGYEVMVGADNKFVVAATGIAEAQIGEVKYQTLADAIADVSHEAPEATTIIVLKAVAADNITIPENTTITFNADGVTITKPIICNGTLNISNGIYQAAITATSPAVVNISGGTFHVKPTGYVCETGKDLIINAEGVYVVTDITSAEAQIGDNMYLTIDKAITAAGTEETTITLLKNPVADIITIPASANITLVINNVESTFEALTKAITVNGTFSIASGKFTNTITLANADGRVNISDGVTKPETPVILSTELSQAKNVLKTKTDAETNITTYWVKKMFQMEVKLTGEPTTEQKTAAQNLAVNTSIAEITLPENHSLTITVTSVELTASKVMKAAFEVKLIGADGEAVSSVADPGITFRLPIHSSITGTPWVNLWHNETAIPGMNVIGETNGYVTVTTTSFSPFSYEIIETPIAQIGETKFGTVAAAITKATATETEITLLQSVSEDISVGEGKNVKFTIGILTVSGTITNAGTLTIADGIISGAVSNTGAAAGTLTISGTTNITGAVSASAGTLAISGGTIDNTITTTGDAVLSITNGTIKNTLSVGGSGTSTISGGEFAEALAATTGTLTISGGAFNKDGDNAIKATSGTINITGGTFNNTTAAAISQTSESIHISGGTFTTAPASTLCVAGYLPLKNDANKFDVKDRWDIVDETRLSDNPHLVNGSYTVKTAEYQRHTGMMSAGNANTMYGTICLPFAITATTSGMKLYKATSLSESVLTITEVTDFGTAISAGTPLIFELSEKASSMTVTCVAASGEGIIVNTAVPTNPTDGNLLRGKYTEETITTGLESIYYLNGDTFHQAVQSLTVPAFRAYLDTTTPSQSSARPSVLSIVKGDGEVTAITETDLFDAVTEVYDLNGRRQSGLQKGVNIMRRADGKAFRVIVK